MLVDGEGQKKMMAEKRRRRDGLKSPTQVILFKKREIKVQSGTPY